MKQQISLSNPFSYTIWWLYIFIQPSHSREDQRIGNETCHFLSNCSYCLRENWIYTLKKVAGIEHKVEGKGNAERQRWELIGIEMEWNGWPISIEGTIRRILSGRVDMFRWTHGKLWRIYADEHPMEWIECGFAYLCDCGDTECMLCCSTFWMVVCLLYVIIIMDYCPSWTFYIANGLDMRRQCTWTFYELDTFYITAAVTLRNSNDQSVQSGFREAQSYMMVHSLHVHEQCRRSTRDNSPWW